jgi:hypothetical protein
VFSTLRKSPNIFGMCGLATHRCVRLLGKFGGRLVHKFHLALKSSGADPSARAQACGSATAAKRRSTSGWHVEVRDRMKRAKQHVEGCEWPA